MRIILNELKKIFNFKMISILFVISLIMYKFFISFYMEYFPNGRPELDEYKICTNMIKKYGNYMDYTEFQDFKKVYPNKIREANNYLKSNKECVKAGIITYKNFKNIDPSNEELTKLSSEIVFEKNVDVFLELQSIESIINLYEDGQSNLQNSYKEEKYKQRIEQLIQGGKTESIFPDLVYYNYSYMIGLVAVLVIFSTMFVLSPIFLRDKKRKIDYLQYTCKKGRGLFKSKVIVALISAFIIATLQIGTVLLVYLINNDIWVFLNSNVNSFLNRCFWYDLTFKEYIILTIIAIYILSFITALITSFISSKASSYIVVVGIQIPILLILVSLVCDFLVSNLMAMSFSEIFNVLLSKSEVYTAYLLLITVSTMLIVIRWKKEKTLEIV